MCQLCAFIRNAEPIGADCPASRPAEITVIAPVKDEEGNIGALIDALLNQTYLPTEIILSDGGSSDKTREIIRVLQKSSGVPIVLIEAGHAYPGRGRNLAIARARNDWIASIDAGIVPDPEWLSELVRTAEECPEARIIYGQFEPVTDTFFTECAAVTYVLPPENRRFIASSLFHRSAWEAANRFREDLRAGEDLLFFEGLDRARVPDAYSKNAVVYWSLRPSIGETFTYFVGSSLHSLRAGLFFNWHFNVTRFYLLLLMLAIVGFFRPAVLVFIPLLLLLRTERRMHRWYRAKAPDQLVRKLLDPSRVLMISSMNVAIDVAMFLGMVLWIVKDCLGTGSERLNKNRKAGVSLDLEQ